MCAKPFNGLPGPLATSFLIYPREETPINGNGKGGNNRRRPFRRKDRGRNNDERWNENHSRQGRGGETPRFDKSRGTAFERPKWTPPQLSTEPIPVPDCPWCGKPIRDLSTAIGDRDTGLPVHFDCVVARIAGGEILEKGDEVTYIGGGRFGIVHLEKGSDRKNFSIKKILEWENKEDRAEWRSTLGDHYSIT